MATKESGMTMILKGACPSKKNLYRRVTVKGRKTLAVDATARVQLDALQFQAQALWKQEPLTHPTMRIQFTCSNANSDRDGMLVSLMDLLQRANVIRNDSVKFCNGPLLLEPALLCAVGDEQVRVELFGI